MPEGLELLTTHESQPQHLRANAGEPELNTKEMANSAIRFTGSGQQLGAVTLGLGCMHVIMYHRIFPSIALVNIWLHQMLRLDSAKHPVLGSVLLILQAQTETGPSHTHQYRGRTPHTTTESHIINTVVLANRRIATRLSRNKWRQSQKQANPMATQ